MSSPVFYGSIGYFPESLCKEGSPYKNVFFRCEGRCYKRFSKESKLNALSMIPVVNFFVGGLRIRDALNNEEISGKERAVSIIRGIADILYLAPLTGIIDLIATIYRMVVANCSSASNQEELA